MGRFCIPKAIARPRTGTEPLTWQAAEKPGPGDRLPGPQLLVSPRSGEAPMRGENRREAAMLAIVSPEQRVPEHHPIRRIKVSHPRHFYPRLSRARSHLEPPRSAGNLVSWAGEWESCQR